MKFDAEFRYLDSLAVTEAQGFELSDNWQFGRTALSGIAIDRARARQIDDVVQLATVDGEPHAQVSAVDVGSFISPDSAIALNAERRGFFMPGDSRGMLPVELAIQLSMDQAAARPALTVQFPLFGGRRVDKVRVFRSVIDSTLLTPEETSELLAVDSEDSLPLRSLYRAARIMHWPGIGQQLADLDIFAQEHPLDTMPDERLSAELTQNPGRFIVTQFVNSASKKLGRWADHRLIPLLHYYTPLGQERAEGSSVYAVESRRTAEQVRHFARFTSPLHRGPDFLNHLTIAAYQEGRDFPYSRDYLGEMAKWFNQIRQQEGRNYTPELPFIPRVLEAISCSQAREAELMERLRNDTATPAEIADALYAPSTPAAKRLAMDHLGQHISQAPEVLTAAIAHGRIPEVSLPSDDGHPFARNLSQLRVLSEFCGEVIIPNHRAVKLNFFKRAADGGRLQFNRHVFPVERGKYKIGLTVVTPDAMQTFHAEAFSTRDAEALVCAQAHEEMKLYDKLPKPGAILSVDGALLYENPSVLLSARLQTLKRTHPTYAYINDGADVLCKVTIDDMAGGLKRQRIIVGRGSHKKAAEQAVARQLLPMLPRSLKG